MDDSLVQSHMRQVRYVAEETTSLEITLHTDPTFDTNKEEALAVAEISDWLDETGRFAPQTLPEDVKRTSSFRLILQKDSEHPDTFDPDVVSLPPAAHFNLIEACRLSARAVDSASVIGPLFWYGFQDDLFDQSMQIIYRKSDSRTGGSPSGFQLFMSHFHDGAVNSSRVIGFYKGMRNNEIAANIAHLRESAQESAHPVLLPLILLGSNIGLRQENHQRAVRQRLLKTEAALITHMTSTEPATMSVEAISAELISCHSRVWKNPGASHKVIEGMDFTLRKVFRLQSESMNRITRLYLARLEFIKERLRGIESFSNTTLSMIDMQRTTLHNLLLHRQNETALQIEQRQQLEAERKFSVNQTWNKNQRTISLLGIFFLPGAFIASIFSTTFFNFQAGPGQTVVSARFWIFWVLTIPITLFVFAAWWTKERLDMARTTPPGEVEKKSSKTK